MLCTPPVQVSADTRAAAPRFSWSPTCGATYLEVTSPDGQEVFWIVQGDTGKIAPGVTYGIAPPAYESRFGPVPLDPGRRYLVRIGLMVEENSFAVVGEQTFGR